MCHNIVDLYLHCSHITIRPSYCVFNPQLGITLVNSGAGNEVTTYPPCRTSSCRSTSLIEHCPNQADPKMHSFLLCCPSCRGKFEHTKYEVVSGDHRERVQNTNTTCSGCDTKSSTLPTCARLNMVVKSAPQNQPSAALQEQAASIFPHGLRFNINLHKSKQEHSHIDGTSELTTRDNKVESEFDMVETYLRFPLTKCHHLIPFKMPETFLDESSDSILPCGCWTGRAPDTQTQEATLFVDYIGVETSFKSVWDVTGLGADRCWACGAVEFEVGNGSEDEKTAVENGNGHGHEGWVRTATRGTSRINKQTGEATSVEVGFLQDCERWRKMEDWKDKWWNGDLAERGAKLMAESRWANTER